MNNPGPVQQPKWVPFNRIWPQISNQLNENEMGVAEPKGGLGSNGVWGRVLVELEESELWGDKKPMNKHSVAMQKQMQQCIGMDHCFF